MRVPTRPLRCSAAGEPSHNPRLGRMGRGSRTGGSDNPRSAGWVGTPWSTPWGLRHAPGGRAALRGVERAGGRRARARATVISPGPGELVRTTATVLRAVWWCAVTPWHSSSPSGCSETGCGRARPLLTSWPDAFRSRPTGAPDLRGTAGGGVGRGLGRPHRRGLALRPSSTARDAGLVRRRAAGWRTRTSTRPAWCSTRRRARSPERRAGTRCSSAPPWPGWRCSPLAPAAPRPTPHPGRTCQRPPARSSNGSRYVPIGRSCRT